MKTKNSYLIERKRQIYYNDLNIPGFEEIHTPITAVKKLTIDSYESGYAGKDGLQPCPQNSQPQAAAPPAPQVRPVAPANIVPEVMNVEEGMIRTDNF